MVGLHVFTEKINRKILKNTLENICNGLSFLVHFQPQACNFSEKGLRRRLTILRHSGQ